MAFDVDTINADAQARMDQYGALVADAITETTSFLTELRESMAFDIPFLDWNPSFIDLPALIVTATEPVRPDLDQEIDSALDGLKSPDSPSYRVVSDIEAPSIRDFGDAMPEMVFPDIPEPDFPDTPVDPTIGTIALPEKPDMALPSTPVLNDHELSDIQIPTKPEYSLPDRPTLKELVFTDVSIPDRPTYDLPSVPQMSDFNFPVAPAITIPSYTPNFPTADLPIPVDRFDWNETVYYSELITAAQAKNLTTIQDGGQGLGAEIETAMIDRGKERDEKLIREAVDDFVSEYSGKAFDLPTGALVAGTRKFFSDYADKGQDRSREITIEMAKLALENYRLAQQNGIAIEGILIAYHQGMAERSLQAARATLDAGIAIFNVKVQEFNAKVQAEVSRAGIYESQIRSELIKLEMHRNQIESVRLQVEVEGKKVDIYRVQVEALNIIQSLYRTDVEGAVARISLEKAKLDANIAQNDQSVNIYKALLESLVIVENLYKTDIQAAGLQVDIEKSKLQAHISKNDEEIRRYIAEIEAVGAVANFYKTEMEGTNLQLAMEKLNIDMFAKKIDAYSSRVMAEAQKYNAYKARTEGELAKATAFEAKARGYMAYVEGQKAISSVQIANQDAKIKSNDQLVRAYEADINLWRAGHASAMERVRSVAQLFESDAGIYRANIGKAEAEGRLHVEQERLISQNINVQQELALQALRSNLEAFVRVAGLKKETAYGGATVAGTKLSALLNSFTTVIQWVAQGTTTKNETT